MEEIVAGGLGLVARGLGLVASGFGLDKGLVDELEQFCCSCLGDMFSLSSWIDRLFRFK